MEDVELATTAVRVNADVLPIRTSVRWLLPCQLQQSRGV